MKNKKFISLIIFTVVTGVCGIVAQTILLREMLILFSGNELSIGVIIGSWILWEATGAYLGGKKHIREELSVKLLIVLTILFCFFFPISIYLTRIFKILAGIPLDTGTGILNIFLASFFVLSFTGFLHGMLFTLICNVLGTLTLDSKTSIGKVYFYEMLGTIAGGILLNYFAIQFFDVFTIAISLCIVSLFSCLPVLFSPKIYGAKRLYLIVIMFLFSSIIILITGGAKVAHDHSVKKQWSNRDIVFYKNSLYQNIVVIKEHEQYAFFTDGIPVLTLPIPDITYTEDIIHLTMLSHKMPEDVLVLSRGAGGVITEILKYKSVKKIDYVETDPQFLETIKLFSIPSVEKELKNPIVKLHFKDGRIFLKNHSSVYDIVFINVPLPYTLQNNRFFTKEFFENVKTGLKSNGIAVVSLPGSMSYYTNELKFLNKCILKTVETVFPFIRIIPGDYNLLILSKNKDSIVEDYEDMYKRFKETKIDARLINRTYLTDRLDETKRQWLLSNLNNVSTEINTDFLPSGFFYTIAYNNLLYSPYLSKFFRFIKQIDIKKIVISLMLVFFLFFFISFRYRGAPVLYSIGTTGFTSIIMELILIFSFQIYFGYVFFEIGILVTVFLSGIALGGIIAIAPFMKRFKDIHVFRTAEMTFVLLSIVVFFVLKYTELWLKFYPSGIKVLFFLLLFITGLCTGIEFPIGSRLYGQNSKKEKTIGSVVGHLYSVDLLGGCIGGFLGGILLSVIGILNGSISLAILKFCSLLLLLNQRNIR